MVKVDKKIVAITGAAGFLGENVVIDALNEGFKVRAVVRPNCDISNLSWANQEFVEVVECDLSAIDSDYSKFIGGKSIPVVDAVIHTAGILVGDEKEHEKQTLLPTRHLIREMYSAGCKRFIHISSMSVYGYSSLPENSQLDETTPLEYEFNGRDSYCKAKCEQEALLLSAAQKGLMAVTALRPGVIYGHQHFWSGRLGFKIGNFLVQLGKNSNLPLINVEDCAHAAVSAAGFTKIKSDVYIDPEYDRDYIGFEAINVIDNEYPVQYQYLFELQKNNIFPNYSKIAINWRLLNTVVKLLSLISIIWTNLFKILPSFLKLPSLHARAKNIIYNNARLHDRLGVNAKYSSYIDFIESSIDQKKR